MLRTWILLCVLLIGTSASAQDFCGGPKPESQKDWADKALCADQRRRERADAERREYERQRGARPQGAPPAPAVIVKPLPSLGPTPAEIRAREEAARAKTEARQLQLERAMLSNDLGTAMKLVAEGAIPPPPRLAGGISLLMLAVHRGHGPLIGGLARSHATVADRAGNTALLHLVGAGDAVDIGTLLDTPAAGAIDLCNADGWSPLPLAIVLGKNEVASRLLERGASSSLNIPCPATAVQPLVAAAAMGRADLVERLLARGVYLGPQGATGTAAVQALESRAVREQLAQSARRTVERMRTDVIAASGDAPGKLVPIQLPAQAVPPDRTSIERIKAALARPMATWSLVEAAPLGQVEAVRAALAAGADPLGDARFRARPLRAAAQQGHTEVVRLILPAVAADPAMLFEALAGAAELNQTAVMRLLLAQPGADDQGGRLSALVDKLLDVARSGPALQTLLEAGVRPEPWRDRVLKTADPTVLKAFMAAGMDVRAPFKTRDAFVSSGMPLKEEGYTPLMAISEGPDRPAVVRVLVEAGVDVNGRTSLGRSALWYAARAKNAGIIEVLLQAKADPNVADHHGLLTPLVLATRGHDAQPRTVQMLVDAGANLQVKGQIGGAWWGNANTNHAVQNLLDRAYFGSQRGTAPPSAAAPPPGTPLTARPVAPPAVPAAPSVAAAPVTPVTPAAAPVAVRSPATPSLAPAPAQPDAAVALAALAPHAHLPKPEQSRLLVQHYLGDRMRSVAPLELAVQLDPANAEAWKWLGVRLGIQGRSDQALAALRKALELSADDPDAWHALGRTLMQLPGQDPGRSQEALQALERAAFLRKLDPSKEDAIAEARAGLGLALCRAQRPAEAASLLESALRGRPQDATLLAAYNQCRRLGGLDAVTAEQLRAAGYPLAAAAGTR